MISNWIWLRKAFLGDDGLYFRDVPVQWPWGAYVLWLKTSFGWKPPLLRDDPTREVYGSFCILPLGHGRGFGFSG
jgi:hypothetical protein